MNEHPLSFTMQEEDLQLFLNALRVKLPPVNPSLVDDYLIIPVDPNTASLFEANDNKAVLLAYRMKGRVFPLSIFFLKGMEEVLFCHSTLLLDSYAQGGWIVPLLRKAVQDLFSQNPERLIEVLEPSWTDAPLNGQLDCRIIWNAKPDMKIVTDLLFEKLGEICEIPLFPSVYYYNNPYEENLLEVALPELDGCKDVLTMGTGAGLEAVCIALKYGIHVDATDINPIAIANTIAASRRTGTDLLVNAWVSNGMKDVRKTYDAILFEAPLATNEIQVNDPNRYDLGGKLLKEVLTALPSHLKTGGRMYLMSCPDLSPYIPDGLQWQVLRHFEVQNRLAIHKIWQG